METEDNAKYDGRWRWNCEAKKKKLRSVSFTERYTRKTCCLHSGRLFLRSCQWVFVLFNGWIFSFCVYGRACECARSNLLLRTRWCVVIVSPLMMTTAATNKKHFKLQTFMVNVRKYDFVIGLDRLGSTRLGMALTWKYGCAYFRMQNE